MQVLQCGRSFQKRQPVGTGRKYEVIYYARSECEKRAFSMSHHETSLNIRADEAIWNLRVPNWAARAP